MDAYIGLLKPVKASFTYTLFLFVIDHLSMTTDFIKTVKDSKRTMHNHFNFRIHLSNLLDTGMYPKGQNKFNYLFKMT